MSTAAFASYRKVNAPLLHLFCCNSAFFSLGFFTLGKRKACDMFSLQLQFTSETAESLSTLFEIITTLLQHSVYFLKKSTKQGIWKKIEACRQIFIQFSQNNISSLSWSWSLSLSQSLTYTQTHTHRHDLHPNAALVSLKAVAVSRTDEEMLSDCSTPLSATSHDSWVTLA